MSSIKLRTYDGELFKVDVAVAKCSGTINNMLANLGFDDDSDVETPVTLQNVHSTILKRVLVWAAYHKDDATPADEKDGKEKEKRTDDIPQWDADFLRVDQATLFEIILAANYLDVKGLMDVCCKTIANMIKGKTPDEIRKTFNIQNDFTEAEQTQIQLENEWCKEQN